MKFKVPVQEKSKDEVVQTLPVKKTDFGEKEDDRRLSASVGGSGRKGYNDEEGKQGSTRGKWFAVKRMTSLALASRRENEDAMSVWKSTSKRPEDLITEEQVKAYHALLAGLSSINGLHACVNHPCGNIYWDFKTKKCLPGRVWQDKMPEDVRQKVDREFTTEEVLSIEEAIHLNSAPPQTDIDPRAIFVIGPAAAGKSAVRPKTEEMLQIKLDEYVEIDGDEFRNKHEGWMSVLNNDKTTGYREALNVLLPYTRKLKKRFLEHAISEKKNIILPSTGSNMEKLKKEVEDVRAQGYRVDVIGLVVSYKEARARALNRAHENGRWNDGTWKKWESAMSAITYFMDPTRSDMCIIFDNQDFLNPQTIYTRTQNQTFVQDIIDAYRSNDKEEGV